MHETIETLKTRRSCRAYQPRQVEEGALQQVLEAGLYAPSGRGAQPVVFVVVQNQATLAELSRLNAAVMGADTDPFYGAPTVIVVLADRSRPTWVEDGSLAMGNLMNAAHAPDPARDRNRKPYQHPTPPSRTSAWGRCCVRGRGLTGSARLPG